MGKHEAADQVQPSHHRVDRDVMLATRPTTLMSSGHLLERRPSADAVTAHIYAVLRTVVVPSTQ